MLHVLIVTLCLNGFGCDDSAARESYLIFETLDACQNVADGFIAMKSYYPLVQMGRMQVKAVCEPL